MLQTPFSPDGASWGLYSDPPAMVRIRNVYLSNYYKNCQRTRGRSGFWLKLCANFGESGSGQKPSDRFGMLLRR